MSYIYAIGWTELNAWYLGARWKKGCDPTDLWSTYFTSSDHVSRLRDEFGEPDVFEIIATGDEETVRELEAEIISHFRLHRHPRWLNRNTGKGKYSTAPHSATARAKMSAAKKGCVPHNKGKPHSEKSKALMRANRKPHVFSEERLAKMSAAMTGEKHPRYGKPVSEETRRKISEAAKLREAKRKAAKEERHDFV